MDSWSPERALSRAPISRSSRARHFCADIVVSQQAARGLKITMSTSPDPGPVNGHLPPAADDHSTHLANGNQSDSELSEAQPAAAGVASPESADAVGSPDDGPAPAQEEEHEEPSASSDNDNAQDDGDFDATGSPESAQSNDTPARATSSSARASAKRKAQIMDDEYIRENPELYGLRRSV